MLMHNHPSGDPTPSRADIQMTQAIVDIATPLGISVHDHIIVGKNGHASLRVRPHAHPAQALHDSTDPAIERSCAG